jgi:putative endonuclease
MRRPVRMIYYEEVETKSLAAKREYAIKKMSRSDKELLIQTKNIS